MRIFPVSFAPDRDASRSEPFGCHGVRLQDADHNLTEPRLERDACFQFVLVRQVSSAGAHFELSHTHAVDADIDVARHLQAMDVTIDGSLQPDPEDILTVDGKVMTRDDAATRSQRELVAETLVVP
jgi:hypothetical protein